MYGKTPKLFGAQVRVKHALIVDSPEYCLFFRLCAHSKRASGKRIASSNVARKGSAKK
jgi:hypothetical protein